MVKLGWGSYCQWDWCRSKETTVTQIPRYGKKPHWLTCTFCCRTVLWKGNKQNWSKLLSLWVQQKQQKQSEKVELILKIYQLPMQQYTYIPHLYAYMVTANPDCMHAHTSMIPRESVTSTRSSYSPSLWHFLAKLQMVMCTLSNASVLWLNTCLKKGKGKAAYFFLTRRVCSRRAQCYITKSWISRWKSREKVVECFRTSSNCLYAGKRKHLLYATSNQFTNNGALVTPDFSTSQFTQFATALNLPCLTLITLPEKKVQPPPRTMYFTGTTHVEAMEINSCTQPNICFANLTSPFQALKKTKHYGLFC